MVTVDVWIELKRDIYFNELIEALEDRQDLIDVKKDATEFFYLQLLNLHGLMKTWADEENYNFGGNNATVISRKFDF